MQKRNATVAVIGAGDFIGGEIAKKFAAEGFTVFVGRRQGEKLEPLMKAYAPTSRTCLRLQMLSRHLPPRRPPACLRALGQAQDCPRP